MLGDSALRIILEAMTTKDVSDLYRLSVAFKNVCEGQGARGEWVSYREGCDGEEEGK